MTRSYFGIVSVVYLLLEKEGKILLLRRANTGYQDGNYSFIAGHVEEGENLLGAIVREAEEEAGIAIEPSTLSLIHVLDRVKKNGRLCFFFTASTWSGEIQNKEPEKCDDLSWWPIDVLPVNCVPYLPQVITCYKKKQFYSLYELMD